MNEIQVGAPVIVDDATTGYQRTTGVRYMSPKMLAKLITWLPGQGLEAVVPAVEFWLDPKGTIDPELAEAAQALLEKQIGATGNTAKKDAYLDAAIFCILALPGSKD